jgi:hypothetical protein
MEYLSGCSLVASAIPIKIRLLQSKGSVDLLAQRQWDTRESALVEFVKDHGPLWMDTTSITHLDPSANLEWMKSPKPKAVTRFFALYGVNDVFGAVTRASNGRLRLTRELGSLVDNRNGIAHGDQTVQPQRTELTEYIKAVRDFCTRADKRLNAALGALSGKACPW